MKRSAVLFAVGLLFSVVSAALAEESVIAPSVLGHLVSGDAIAQALLRELGVKLPTGHVELKLDNPLPRLVASPAASPELGVDQLSYDARSGRVQAFVTLESDDAEMQRVRVAGHVIRLIDLPVLTRMINPGETIGEGDVMQTAFQADRVGQNLVSERSALIGKTPRISLRAQEPVHSNEILVPIAVHKGDLVTLVLHTPSLTLTTQGKAVEDAPNGGSIRVANAKSGRVIDGLVSGPNTVNVAVPLILSP